MKVYRFKCKDCGSKSYEKIGDNTYRCLYCGNVEEVFEKSSEKQPNANQPDILDTKKDDQKSSEQNGKEAYKKILDNPKFLSALIKLIVCIFLGEFGIHRFLEKKIFTGIIYLFTFGLFGIGWFVDIVRCGIDLAQETVKFSKEQENQND